MTVRRGRAYGWLWLAASGWLGGTVLVPQVSAQMVHVATPQVRIHERFYENFRFGWRWNGVQPHGLWLEQGNRRTISAVTPSLTFTPGVPAGLFHGSVRPFVTGWVPVVGGYSDFSAYGSPIPGALPFAPGWGVPASVGTSPLVEKLARLNEAPPPPPVLSPAEPTGVPVKSQGAVVSSAERGDLSLAEIRRGVAAEKAARTEQRQQLTAEARQAEQQGQSGLARLRYRQAAALASGAERDALLRAADQLR